MSDAAQLVLRARERQGITVEQLGIRTGLPSALIADAEAGRRDLTDQQLVGVLLVCGLQLKQSAGGELTVTPLELDIDAHELAHARSLTMTERLQTALGWNSFADRVFQAGRRDPGRTSIAEP